MKSITIHNLNDRLATLIEKKARESGNSLNKTIKVLLQQALGLKPEAERDNKEEFADLFGVWNENDFKEFEESVKDFEEVDPEDWK